MTLFLMILVILLLGGGLGWLFLHDPGYVLIAWNQTSVELSLSLAVIFLVVAAVACLILLEVLLGVFGLRKLLSRWSEQWRGKRTQRLLAEGTSLWMRGELLRAEKKLQQSARLATTPLAAVWLASECARTRQQHRLAEEYLDEVAGRIGHLPLELMRLRLWMDSGRWEAAAARLKSLLGHYRKEPALAEMLVDTLIRLQAWEELSDWLPRLAGALSRERSQALAISAHREVMTWLATTGGRMERASALRRLKEYWSALSPALRAQPELAESCAEGIAKLGFDDEAEQLTRETLERKWHHGLLLLYGRLRTSLPDQALKQAQSWQSRHAGSPVLWLTLGRLHLQNRDWQSARECFEHSLSLGKSTEAYAEYVRLLQHLNDPEAIHYLVAGLQQLTNRPLPPLPMP